LGGVEVVVVVAGRSSVPSPWSTVLLLRGEIGRVGVETNDRFAVSVDASEAFGTKSALYMGVQLLFESEEVDGGWERLLKKEWSVAGAFRQRGAAFASGFIQLQCVCFTR
jgi:hypothetical protein